MKQSIFSFLVALGIVTLLLSGCATVGSVMGDVNAIVSGSEESDDSGSDRGGKSTGDAGGGLLGAMLLGESGMLDMQDYMIAMTLYSQSYYAGGFAYGYDDFAEGEGVIWDVRSRDGESETEVNVERALLKRDGDGAWWFLASDSGTERIEAEAYIDGEQELLIFRYRDPETGEIREWRPEEEGDDAAEEKSVERSELESTMEESEPEFYDGELDEYIVGQERVTVPAGTFQTDHVMVDEGYTYEWWITDDVPGQLVKYEWQDDTQEAAMTGELADILSGVTTRFESY